MDSYYNNNNMNNNMRYGNDSGKSSRNGSNFILGLVVGMALALLVSGFVFVGVKVYEAVGSKHLKKTSTADSVVNEDTEKKLAAIEDVINEYYYQDADIDVDAMTEGMYAGMVSALGDPYSVYYTEEEWDELTRET
ncbi:MAG: hypothetical protein K2M70_10130 [Lachnospiraceae bacterium]|nr:hypothetical protein [Lachnospiraceae bacterium]